jgi:osmotically-inducible protein OsmY
MSQPNGGFRGVGPKNYSRTDDQIREDVCERLLHDADVDASEIEVDVREGQVILTGTVGERSAKWLAEDLAQAASGEKNVVNKLKVSSLEKELRR